MIPKTMLNLFIVTLAETSENGWITNKIWVSDLHSNLKHNVGIPIQVMVKDGKIEIDWSGQMYLKWIA
jgi:hypothetical protein